MLVDVVIQVITLQIKVFGAKTRINLETELCQKAIQIVTNLIIN